MRSELWVVGLIRYIFIEYFFSELIRKNFYTLKKAAKIMIFAHIAQEVEHFLGKEEVTGSTPVMSSR